MHIKCVLCTLCMHIAFPHGLLRVGTCSIWKSISADNRVSCMPGDSQLAKSADFTFNLSWKCKPWHKQVVMIIISWDKNQCRMTNMQVPHLPPVKVVRTRSAHVTAIACHVLWMHGVAVAWYWRHSGPWPWLQDAKRATRCARFLSPNHLTHAALQGTSFIGNTCCCAIRVGNVLELPLR